MSLALHERQFIDTPSPAQESGSRGKVYLVGAGPGDPELIAVKALRCLRACDVVVYDRLINPQLLEEAPGHATRVFAGKEAGNHAMRQDALNGLLITFARQGRCVVRLKGGDPFVFGRGGEEALALAQAGITFEIVPGVSSAIAVPAYAGIPITHRELASSVTIVTGHSQRTSTPSEVNWEALAQTGGTLVIMMGVEAIEQITRQLLDAGLAPETNAAIIQEGTVPQQRVVSATLATIAGRAREANIQSPAITVIGAVASLSESLAWFHTPIGKSAS